MRADNQASPVFIFCSHSVFRWSSSSVYYCERKQKVKWGALAGNEANILHVVVMSLFCSIVTVLCLVMYARDS